jgi:hypothetical protein
MSVMPPAAAPPAPAAKPKRHWGRWLALGCGGIIVLGALFAGAMYVVVRKATAGPEQVVKEFLSAAAAGDYAAAHGYFSAPLKHVQPLAAFTSMAKANPEMFAITDTTFSNRSVDTTGAELSGTVTLKSGTELPASFKLVREKKEWRLIAYHLGSQ